MRKSYYLQLENLKNQFQISNSRQGSPEIARNHETVGMSPSKYGTSQRRFFNPRKWCNSPNHNSQTPRPRSKSKHFVIRSNSKMKQLSSIVSPKNGNSIGLANKSARYGKSLNQTSRLNFSKSKDLSRRKLDISKGKKSNQSGSCDTQQFFTLKQNLKEDSNPLTQQYKLTASYTNRSLKQRQMELNSTLRKSHNDPRSQSSRNIFQKSQGSVQSHFVSPNITSRENTKAQVLRPCTPLDLKNHIKMIYRHKNYVKNFNSTKKDIERARLKKHQYNESAYRSTIKDVKTVRSKLYVSRKKIIEKNTSYIIQQKLQVKNTLFQ